MVRLMPLGASQIAWFMKIPFDIGLLMFPYIAYRWSIRILFFWGILPKKRCNQDFCIDNYTTMSYNFAHEKVIDKMVQKMV